MLRLLFWLFALPILVAVMVFAAMNPNEVQLNLWPVTDTGVPFPLYGVGLVGLLAGFLLGAVVGLLRRSGARARVRTLVQQTERDQREIASLKERLTQAERAQVQATGLPAPARDAA
ncbi:conserved exported hypothetical protein [Candidatus Defluviicoccus seviourii]|uniref:Uncharacterized protein n=2 Tax=root TaxID=1 RepID=A0A564WEF0_9PROT|nr:conserved exported hypothetical protein [uncultured Defluviicoccus sp.]VUX46845.1 conserved exported hypothetical protein [Candidatus Defluviicoccus seviourii]